MSVFGMRGIKEVSVYTEEGKLIETLDCLTSGEIGSNFNITSTLYSTKLLQWLYGDGDNEKTDFQNGTTNQCSINIRKIEPKYCKLIIKSEGGQPGGEYFPVTYVVDEAYLCGINAIEMDVYSTSNMNLTFKLKNITMQLPVEK